MKTMKKFLAAAMAVTSIMAFAPMSAFAANETGGSTNVEFDAPHVSPEFIITIPKSVALSSSTSTATITATDVYLDTEKHTKINVTLDEASNTESGSTFTAKTQDGDSSATYTIGKDTATTGISLGDTVAEFTAGGTQTLSFSAPEGATYAGTHTEVLTFGVKAVSIYSTANVNEVVTFGGYQWYVIEKDTEKEQITLLMKDSLGQMAYHNETVDVTWATCTLHNYLNNDFYNTFSEEDKEMIAETEITDSGTTTDYIYLLSMNEANQLNRSVQANGTNWWLRTPSSVSQQAMTVPGSGGVSMGGQPITWEKGSIRPALTLNY